MSVDRRSTTARRRGIWLGKEVEDPLAADPTSFNKFPAQRKRHKLKIHLKPK
jgi:hypothetical protein